MTSHDRAAMTARYTSAIVALLVGLYVVQAVYAIVSWRFLFADGSEFFIQILEYATVFQANSPHRLFARIVTQGPLLLALHLGITDLTSLKLLFGFGLYLPYLVCLGIWLHATRGRRELMAFPLLFLFASAANSEFFIISESHAAAAFFFSLLPLMLLKPHWNAGMTILGCLLAIATLLAYPTMVTYGPVLILISAWRARTATTTAGRLGWIVATAWFFAGTIIAVRDIFWPAESVTPADGFVSHAVSMLRDHIFGPAFGSINLHFGAILSLLTLAVIAFAAFAVPRRDRLVRIALAGFALICVSILLALAIFPVRMEMPLHYKARVLQLFIPPLLAIALLFVVWRGWSLPVERLRTVLTVVALLGIFQCAWHLQASHQWTGYLRVFRAELATHDGFVPVQATALAKRLDGRQVIEKFNWGWSLPQMSILLAPGGQVRSIIGNPENDRILDPTDPAQLPDLARYGIDYAQYLSHPETF
jgi:hypothetical protein